MIVKICGITREQDMAAAIDAGADWIGLNFWPGSRRHVTPDRGRALARVAAQGRVTLVGVFVNQPAGDVARIAARVGLDMVQLHGDEVLSEYRALVAGGVTVLRAVAMAGDADIARVAGAPGDVVLVDTPTAGYGGSGRAFDWTLAERAVTTGKRIILAGGLNPTNVAAAVARVRPFGVDVASGVEAAPGIKDPAAMRTFIAAVRAAPAPI